VAINLYNLGLTYEVQGNKSTAKQLYRKAREIGKKVFKPNDGRLKMIRDKAKE